MHEQTLIKPWQPDPENGVYLGLVFSDPNRVQSTEGDLPEGRFSASEFHENLARGNLTIAGPACGEWHEHDDEFRIAGLQVIARSAAASEELRRTAIYAVTGMPSFGHDEIAGRIVPAVDMAVDGIREGRYKEAARAIAGLGMRSMIKRHLLRREIAQDLSSIQ